MYLSLSLSGEKKKEKKYGGEMGYIPLENC